MHRRHFVKLAAGASLAMRELWAGEVSIPADLLEDKIRGGFIGQVIGDLNGLKHEMKYIAEPGNVETYTPALPEGAWTDDDTDVEWVYLIEIQRTNKILIPRERISELWRRHINRRIWCSHLYLRQLMDLGINPPLTGRIELNPWADFNLSGQFVSESWGLISPGMPQTAAKIGTYYTHVGVEGEAVQSTQMMDAMIATAFLTNDLNRILDAGARALDPKSVLSEIVADVRAWHRQYPADWRRTRLLTKQKYCKYGGNDLRDRNGVWLNGGSTIGALLYGNGDFVETVRHAFNFGWDADNNAAASGTIVGVMKGAKWLLSQGWNIGDRFRNTSRDEMPDNETLTSFGDRLIALARQVTRDNGGRVLKRDGKEVFVIETQEPANVERLPDLKAQYAAMRSDLEPEIDKSILNAASAQDKARAAYLAICLDLAPGLVSRRPQEWKSAIAALSGYPNLMQVIFYEGPFPAGDRIRANAIAAGLTRPATSIKLWT